MLDVIVGIAIACFVILGAREGIAKALGSVILVFAALFLATRTIDFFAQGAEQFKDPNFLGTIIIFFLVWLLSYLVLDLILNLLFRRAIKIIVLGPLDMVGGLFIGGFKGVLICGIILQLVLALPISADSKKYISGAKLSGLSISVYQWAYPQAKRLAPKIGNLMKIDILEEMNKENEVKGEAELSPEKIMGQASEVGKTLTEQEKNIRKLIEDNKLILNVPQTEAKK
jgi:uncharacterized membrane protein required for colicin V production